MPISISGKDPNTISPETQEDKKAPTEVAKKEETPKKVFELADDSRLKGLLDSSSARDSGLTTLRPVKRSRPTEVSSKANSEIDPLLDGKPTSHRNKTKRRHLMDLSRGVMEWSRVSQDKANYMCHNMREAIKALRTVRGKMVEHAKNDPKFAKILDIHLSKIDHRINELKDDIAHN